jgi:hypothetical protein
VLGHRKPSVIMRVPGPGCGGDVGVSEGRVALVTGAATVIALAGYGGRVARAAPGRGVEAM